MDTFDYVIASFGAVLIVIGLYLFVAGKIDSTSSSNVEGFGIKLNISNPSILLIVIGVLLLLVPRLLPNGSPQPQSNADPTVVFQPTAMPGEQNGVSETAPQNVVMPEQTKVFLPSGVWQLSSYSESGVDLSTNISGSMTFVSTSQLSVSWSSNFLSRDYLGNVYNYSYQGVTSSDGNNYSMTISNSNDPNFFTQGPIPLELKMENNGILHMRYIYQGEEILLHWQQ
jgi:hypothetical protein